MTPDAERIWTEATAGIKPLPRRPLVPFEPKRGRVPIRDPFIDHTLDLHGFTIEDAFTETQRFVYNTRAFGYRYATVITGKSGAICEEFPAWVERIPAISRIETLNGGGAFRVYFRKR